MVWRDGVTTSVWLATLVRSGNYAHDLPVKMDRRAFLGLALPIALLSACTSSSGTDASGQVSADSGCVQQPGCTSGSGGASAGSGGNAAGGTDVSTSGAGGTTGASGSNGAGGNIGTGGSSGAGGSGGTGGRAQPPRATGRTSARPDATPRQHT